MQKFLVTDYFLLWNFEQGLGLKVSLKCSLKCFWMFDYMFLQKIYDSNIYNSNTQHAIAQPEY